MWRSFSSSPPGQMIEMPECEHRSYYTTLGITHCMGCQAVLEVLPETGAAAEVVSLDERRKRKAQRPDDSAA